MLAHLTMGDVGLWLLGAVATIALALLSVRGKANH